MNARSLRFQLGLWYAGLLTTVFILLGVATIVLLKHFMEANVRDSQLRRARQVAQGLSPEIVKKGAAAIADEVEARFSPGLNNRFIQIRSSEGQVIYRSPDPADHSFEAEAIPSGRWPERVESFRKAGLPDGGSLLISRYLVKAPGGTAWLVEAGAPLHPLHAVLRGVAGVMALTLLVAVAVAVAGGYFLVGRALDRVDHISRSAEEISFHNLSGRLPIAHTGDEIERLSESLNRMIQRLDGAFQHSKRFVADASHELRTPLTILRGEMEALLARESLAPAVQERLGSLLEEVDRLTKIVEGLLMLSRLDAGEAQGEWVNVDLAKLTTSTAEQMALLAEDKRIRIRCITPSPVLVRGDRARLKQVVVNLLDNAIKYTADGGKVTLQVSTQPSQAVLDVTDSGPGISAEALPHVFERFFRADQARSRDAGGAGLGLAIVHSICAAHDGRVTVESAAGQGSRFRVELPLGDNSVETRQNDRDQTKEVPSHDPKIPKQMGQLR
jgi:heavy metal sensor kinase